MAGLKKITKAKTIDPKEVYFSIGAPEYGEIINLRALHLQDWRDFIGFYIVGYAKTRTLG